MPRRYRRWTHRPRKAAAGEKRIRAVASVGEVGPLGAGDYLLLAVKPQAFPEAANELRGRMGEGVVVVSVMAGVTIARIGAALGVHGAVVRAMPNMAAAVRGSVTAMAGADGGGFAERLLGAVGSVVRIDEELMDAFTAVASSGPAYVFYLAEAVREGAVKAGFEAGVADAITRGMIEGASRVLMSDLAPAGELRARVTSKGGTTEAAVSVLEERGTKQAVIDAIIAARDRGRELGRGDRN